MKSFQEAATRNHKPEEMPAFGEGDGKERASERSENKCQAWAPQSLPHLGNPVSKPEQRFIKLQSPAFLSTCPLLTSACPTDRSEADRVIRWEYQQVLLAGNKLTGFVLPITQRNYTEKAKKLRTLRKPTYGQWKEKHCLPAQDFLAR